MTLSSGRKQHAEALTAESFFAELQRRRTEQLNNQKEGVAALSRLLSIARRDSGQCRHVAAFLLSLYNGSRFKMDLTDFRCLDKEIFEDCITVLRMDYAPMREVHTYFENGGEIWEQLARDWNVTDYHKLVNQANTAS